MERMLTEVLGRVNLGDYGDKSVAGLRQGVYTPLFCKKSSESIENKQSRSQKESQERKRESLFDA